MKQMLKTTSIVIIFWGVIIAIGDAMFTFFDNGQYFASLVMLALLIYGFIFGMENMNEAISEKKKG